MKIYVYAISKNESKFCKRWYDSVREADGIYVLDTGSDDDTVSLLSSLGVVVRQQKISPWRFDTARNVSLSMVPDDADVCVCCDLDEVFVSGWRKAIEEHWTKEVKQASYNYIWSFDADGRPGHIFQIEKIHTRHDFEWTHPVHEVLKYIGKEEYKKITLPITLEHHPDKTKSRASYLELLELSVAESPEDDRNTHYLGREYMYRGMWRKSIETLQKHLSLKSATWADERCASMRFIAKDYIGLGDKDKALLWLYTAIAQAPNLREPYIEAATLLYNDKNFYGAVYFCLKALEIDKRTPYYITEPFAWNEYPYDLLSYSLYRIGNYDEAVFYAEKATQLAPENTRLKSNLEFFRKAAREKRKEPTSPSTT